MTKYDCCVIGAGTFGTKLAHHLERHGRDVIATHHDSDHLQQLDLTHKTTDNRTASNQSRITCLTVRPNQVSTALDELNAQNLLVNYTPKSLTQHGVLHVASTPPLHDNLHYVGYDDTHAKPHHVSVFRDIIGDTAQHVEPVENHAKTLARMTQLYATTLTYSQNLGLSDAQQGAFLRLATDTVQTTPSVDELLTEAATQAGFTATVLDTTEAITELQQHQNNKLKEVLNDI